MIIDINMERVLSDEKLIEISVLNALYSRMNDDSFTNFFEILSIYNKHNKIEGLVQEIKGIFCLNLEYIQEESFYYYYPKDDLFSRRCIYQTFKDYAIRYHLVNVLSLIVKNSFIKNSYSGRTQRKKRRFSPIFKEYFPQWKKFNNDTQKILDLYSQQKKEKYILLADITSFFDSVVHEYMIEKIFQMVGSAISKKYLNLFTQIFKAQVEFYSVIDEEYRIEYKNHGLFTGSITESLFANIILNPLDETMIRNNYHYFRYMDDIRVITNSKKDAIKAFSIIQEELHQIGLNLNSKKTEIVNNPNSVKDFSSSKRENSLIYEIENDAIADISEDEDLVNKAYEKFCKINLDLDIQELITEKYSVQDICTILTDALKNIKIDIYGDLIFGNSKYPVEEKVFSKLIYKIPEIMHHHPKKIRMNVWKVVSIVCVNQYLRSIQLDALKIIIKILKSEDLMDYAKTRLIYHLIKIRAKEKEYLKLITEEDEALKAGFINLFQGFIPSKSIDLSLSSIYALFLLIQDEDILKDYIYEKLPRPLPYSISRVLAYVFQGEARYHHDELTSLDELLRTSHMEKESFDDLEYDY